MPVFQLSTNISTFKYSHPSYKAVKNMRITHRRHLFPLYCLGGYKTIFMFFCPLSNCDILKTSNNTWLDQTVLSAVQICFGETITKSSHRQTKHFTRRVIGDPAVVSNVLLTQSVGSKDVRPQSKGDPVSEAGSKFKQNFAAVSKFGAAEHKIPGRGSSLN